MGDELPQSQWGMIVTLLSMDGVLPFYEAMGLTAALEVSPVDAVQLILPLREMILRNREEYVSDPSVTPALAPKLQSVVAANFGDRAESRVVAWAKRTFKQVHADQPEWSAWNLVFFRWVFGQRKEDLEAIPSCRTLLKERFTALADMDELEELAESAKTSLLSDWDLEMCSLHGFDPFDDAADYFGPVLTTAEVFKTQQFFREVVPQLSEQEKSWLHSQGQLLVAEMKVWMPGPLPGLDQTMELLPW